MDQELHAYASLRATKQHLSKCGGGWLRSFASGRTVANEAGRTKRRQQE